MCKYTPPAHLFCKRARAAATLVCVAAQSHFLFRQKGKRRNIGQSSSTDSRHHSSSTVAACLFATESQLGLVQSNSRVSSQVEVKSSRSFWPTINSIITFPNEVVVVIIIIVIAATTHWVARDLGVHFRFVERGGEKSYVSGA